jgi:hypothetical protein
LKPFSLGYFLIRFLTAALLTGCIVLFLLASTVGTGTESHWESLSSDDPKLIEKEYWDRFYDYHKVRAHSTRYRFGKVVSETWEYMDGRKVTIGVGENDLLLIECTTAALIFMIVFSVVPTFLKRTKTGAALARRLQHPLATPTGNLAMR